MFGNLCIYLSPPILCESVLMRYTNGSISDGFRKELECLFDDLEKKKIDSGYKSLSEFCKDALRRRIEEIREGYLQD